MPSTGSSGTPVTITSTPPAMPLRRNRDSALLQIDHRGRLHRSEFLHRDSVGLASTDDGA